MLLKMQKFLSSHFCRRKLLLAHFKKEGDSDSPAKQDINKNCCDNCRKYAENGSAQESEKDFTQEAYNCIGALKYLLTSMKYGHISASVLVLYLMGSKNQTVTKKLSPEQLKSDFFGSGATGKKCDKWWKEFIQQLTIADYLKLKPVALSYGKGSYNVLEITRTGEQFLSKNDRSFKIMETMEMKAQDNNTRAGTGTSYSAKGKFDVKSLPK